MTYSDAQPLTGTVTANPAAAARAGESIFAEGGNAMDAAVAAALVCSVLRPSACGLGGYVGAALVRDGRDGRVWSVDGDGPAPRVAHPAMYRVLPRHPTQRGINENEYFCTVENDANLFGPTSVSVPGQMAAMGIIHERWGVLPWARVIAPAQRIVADGFPYDDLARSIGVMEVPLRRYEASVTSLMVNGRLPRPDDTFQSPHLEATLARLAGEGWRDFYEGQLGQAIADSVSAAGGLLTRQDMAEYQPRVTPPVSIRYRGRPVHTAILPNGGLTVLQALLMLDQIELPREDDPRYWHFLAEVLKLAWRDRLQFLGDPGFVPVPQDRLLNKDYGLGRSQHLRDFPRNVDQCVPDLQAGPGAGTLHLATADIKGNLVSLTISQGNTFGSCFTVPGTGIVLGHGMCRLDPRPGRANSLAGGKRPLNNAAPLMIEATDRVIAIGAPGGRKIISAMVRAAQLLVDEDLDVEQACQRPRLHVEAAEPLVVQSSVPESISEGLRHMGHKTTSALQIAGVMNAAAYDLKTHRTCGGSGLGTQDAAATATQQTNYRQMGAAGGQ